MYRRTVMAHRLYVIPPDAPVHCEDLARDPLARSISAQVPYRAALRGRFTGLAHRRVRRLVRRLFRVTRPLGPWRLRWRRVDSLTLESASCAETTCRYHLAEFYQGTPIGAGCALRVAGVGHVRQRVIGQILGGMKRQWFYQMVEAALGRRELRGLAALEEAPPTNEEIMRGALAKLGNPTMMDLVRATGLARPVVREMLAQMVEAGVIVQRGGAVKDGVRAGQRYHLVSLDEGRATAVGSA